MRNSYTCPGIVVVGDHLKEVSIEYFPCAFKIESNVRLTSIFDSAIVNMCGGDEPRAEYGRTTSMGGIRAGSQLRNRPLGSVRFYFAHTHPEKYNAGNRLPEINLEHINNVNDLYGS